MDLKTDTVTLRYLAMQQKRVAWHPAGQLNSLSYGELMLRPHLVPLDDRVQKPREFQYPVQRQERVSAEPGLALPPCLLSSCCCIITSQTKIMPFVSELALDFPP